MSSSPTSFTSTSGAPPPSGISGRTEASQADVPHEWHISGNLVPASSPQPSTPPLSPSSPYPSSDHSTSASPAPTRAPAKRAPAKSRSKSTTARKAKSPGHVPRPPNAFMIFRQLRSKEVKDSQAEHDHRIISKVLGKVWKGLGKEEKGRFIELAAEAKRKHDAENPGYRYRPKARAQQKKKRNVQRTGELDALRNAYMAELILAKIDGDALKARMDEYDRSTSALKGGVEDSGDFTTHTYNINTWLDSSASEASSSSAASAASSPPSSAVSRNAELHADSPPFRSPLLPPQPSSGSPQSPAVMSPLEMPAMTGLSGYPVAPAAPGASYRTPSGAPILTSVSLPPVADQTAMHLSGGYQQSYLHSSEGLTLEMSQSQPQGELGLTLYPAQMDTIMLPTQEQPYATTGYQYPADVDYSASYAAQSPSQPFPHYGLVQTPPSMDDSWTNGQFTAEQYATIREAQQYGQSSGFGTQPALGFAPQTAQTGYPRSEWQWDAGSALEFPASVQPQPQPPASWMVQY